MSFDAKRIYELLPAIYRVRDAEGDPERRYALEALIAVIAEQVAVLEEDLAQLYDDHFIETCAEWAVPYIGDLVGTRGIFSAPEGTFSQRAQVANTVAYRRRKGTATVLEELARDVTGWGANVVEYFQRLATTQYLNHLRPNNLSFTSLRKQMDLLEYLNTPFDATARTADLRRIEPGRGKHNIANVGIHLWRIESFPVNRAPAFRLDQRRFKFDPLGRDIPLFNHVESETDISHLATPANVPMPLRRRVLNDRLADYYGKDTTDKEISLLVAPSYHSPGSPPSTDSICVCDLSDVRDDSGNLLGWAHMPAAGKIAIDPVLGRIALPEDAARVDVNYQYGFASRMGGGTYGRVRSFSNQLQHVVKVPTDHATLQAAVNAIIARGGGVVEIEENNTYFETLAVVLPRSVTVELRAADERRAVLFLHGDMIITGEEESKFILNGLWIAGGNVRLPQGSNALGTLTIRHCTLSPALTPDPFISSPPDVFLSPVELFAESSNLSVEIEQSITGPLRIGPEADATLSDSIIDAGAPEAMAYAHSNGQDHGGPLRATNCTFIGQVRAEVLTLASNTIFFARPAGSEPPVEARRLQEGCVRFSFVPARSRVPRQYQCQPQTALMAMAEAHAGNSTANLSPVLRNQVLARVKPVFTRWRFGDPAYGQLSQATAPEIRQGAEDEAEMGAFHDLYQPQRESNLRTRLDEYLRFGLEAGTFYAS